MCDPGYNGQERARGNGDDDKHEHNLAGFELSEHGNLLVLSIDNHVLQPNGRVDGRLSLDFSFVE
jgi:hypothetical protein